MRIVIMADGKGNRWANHLGTVKHLVEISGEPLLKRTVRMINEICADKSEVIVTSHDLRYEFDGSRRYEPLNNVLEIDRFTEELVEDNMCFLYGDTYYTQEALKKILLTDITETEFFGNRRSIVAIRIVDSEEFKAHKQRVRDMFVEGEISACKGWQVYQSFTNQNIKKQPVIGERFNCITDITTDINTAEDYTELV